MSHEHFGDSNDVCKEDLRGEKPGELWGVMAGVRCGGRGTCVAAVVKGIKVPVNANHFSHNITRHTSHVTRHSPYEHRTEHQIEEVAATRYLQPRETHVICTRKCLQRVV